MDTKALKDKILQLAIQGKLVPQDENDEPASVLFEKIKTEKERLIKDKKIKTEKQLPEIIEDEIPYELPKGWEWVRLGECTQINPRNNIDDNLDTSFIPMKLICEGFRSEYSYEIKKWNEIKKGFTHFADNDVILAKITPCFQNRKSAVMKNLINGYGAGTTELYVIRSFAELIIPEYILYIFKTEEFLKSGVETCIGTAGQQRVKKDYIKNLVIGLPPLKEQMRIVEKIDYLFKLIDELNTNKQDLLQNISNARNKVLQLAAQGKLVPQDENDEPASVLLEKIKAEKERLIKEKKIKKEKQLPEITEDEIPYELPKGWEWVRLGNITICRDGERIPLSKIDREERKGIYDYYGASGVIDKIDGYLFEKPLLLIGEDGANLITRSKPIAFIAEGKYWVNNHAHVLDASEYTILKYIEKYINFINLKPYITGTAQPKMNQAKLNSISIPLPPLNEQKRIVEKLDYFMEKFDKLEEQLTK